MFILDLDINFNVNVLIFDVTRLTCMLYGILFCCSVRKFPMVLKCTYVYSADRTDICIFHRLQMISDCRT